MCRLKSHGKILLGAVCILSILQFHTTFSATDSNTTEQKFQLHQLVDLLQYAKYLKEVMELLKGDNSLKAKIHLQNITSGNLAEHLDGAGDKVRTQLDEIKRQELYRIRQLSEELKTRGHPENVIRNSVKMMTKHLDLKNLARFGTEDLRKLILQANGELAILDSKRRESFKEYEMHKALEFEELVKRLSPEEQAEVLKNKAALLAEHKRRQPTNMPASKDHLMKVWEERDRLNKENFNVKTFFHLHDLDGNAFLDEYEIKMLLENEVLDTYDTSAPDYDPREREEDMERMREYTFRIIDTNKDHMVDLDEFIENSKRTGYDDHVFWENVKSVPIFTDEEYAAYAELNRAEVNRMIDEKQVSLPVSGVVQHNPDVGKIMQKKLKLS